MVTAKKRQEFRIKLQKRARRRAEKKIEILEEDKGLKEVREKKKKKLNTSGTSEVPPRSPSHSPPCPEALIGLESQYQPIRASGWGGDRVSQFLAFDSNLKYAKKTRNNFKTNEIRLVRRYLF